MFDFYDLNEAIDSLDTAIWCQKKMINDINGVWNAASHGTDQTIGSRVKKFTDEIKSINAATKQLQSQLEVLVEKYKDLDKFY